MVLPFIESARHGVEYLGQLIKQYGSWLRNSVLFPTKIAFGTWKSPAIIGLTCLMMRMRLRPIRLRFNKSILTPTICLGEGIQNLSKPITSTDKKAGISPHFRHDEWKDRHYNTPRVWYGHKLLNPEIEADRNQRNCLLSCGPIIITREDIARFLAATITKHLLILMATLMMPTASVIGRLV